MLVNILLWALFGLIAGAIAKFLLPGKGPGGWIMTIVLGIAGALLGGFLSSHLLNLDVTGFNLQSIAIAVGGAILVLILYGLVASRGASAR
jgi:uncharacterized membrane protein YeaQ/YmgE (transglycosylase-associated protein family)